MSMENNAKLFALRETIKQAIKDGNLVEKMDVIKLQSIELGLEDLELNELIKEIKKEQEKHEEVSGIAQANKKLLVGVSAALVIVEWVLGLIIAKLSLAVVLWLLLANIVTIFIVVIATSIIINKNLKK